MAVRSGEVAFVRRLRTLFAQSAADQDLTPRELAKLEGRVLRSTHGTTFAGVRTPRFVLLAATAAICVIWFMARPVSQAPRVPSAEAYSLDASRDRQGLRKIELDTLLKALPGESVVPSPMLVADFERIEDLAKVMVVGPGIASLSSNARMGRRSLRTDAGPAESPSVVILAMPAAGRAQFIHTVSAWVFAQIGPVDVALETGGEGGTPSAGILSRHVEPGEWRWVTFTIPGASTAGAGAPIPEVRLRLTGVGPVLLDQVEAWCAGGSHGG